ncbi:MAG: hypothetical protein AAGD25_10105 [Cyanobacteria bacterium P01_F01_bin.150]
MVRLLKRILGLPQEEKITFDCYGEDSSGVSHAIVQEIMEWISLSLYHCGYRGNAQVIWYNEDVSNDWVQEALQEGIRKDEPVLLYRTGMTTSSAPTGYYWRMVPEHPSTRIYQLERHM